jgi:hypothetical protein
MPGLAPPRQSRDDALKRIRRCLDDGEVIPTKHFREKLEELSMSMVEVLYILRHGLILNEPEFELRYREWNYRIEGTEPEGQHLAIVFTFIEEVSGLLITIFSIEK